MDKAVKIILAVAVAAFVIYFGLYLFVGFSSLGQLQQAKCHGEMDNKLEELRGRILTSDLHEP